jgi:sec-independent protein translocase protein TatC
MTEDANSPDDIAKAPEETPAAAPPGETEKPFIEHLMELRSRILVCLFGVVLCMIAAWIFYDHLVVIIKQPLLDYNATVPVEAQARLLATSMSGPFVFVLSLGLWAGLLVSSPLIIWQIWRFVSPGLYRREKLAILPIFTIGIFFFAGGVLFAYTYTLPAAIRFLVPYAARLGAEMRPTLGEYLRFVIMILASFGIAFETPLVILALARLGLVTAGGLARKWQYMIVVSFVLGAFLTPPDVVTQLMMAGCLASLYVLSIVLALLFGKRSRFERDDGDKADKKVEGDAPSV